MSRAIEIMRSLEGVRQELTEGDLLIYPDPEIDDCWLFFHRGEEVAGLIYGPSHLEGPAIEEVDYREAADYVGLSL